MYLAPFNYDRFFERVFKHTHIAKRFLEDMLGEKIEEIEPLPRKNKITDDAAFVEFDYRCKIKGKYVIVDMQQWYKKDVVKRFFLYFCNNTSLQLENLKEVSIPLLEKKLLGKKEFKSKKYDGVVPSITLIWMANDTLGFVDDIIAFTMLPEIFINFIKDKKLWKNLNPEDLLAYREKVLSICNNKTKKLDFLAKNRLIYAFQPNIVKNHREGKSEKLNQYIPWFQFAQKTLNKNNTAEDFEIFKNEPIIMEVIELLKTSELSSEDFQYITDYAAYEKRLANYNESIIEEAVYDLNEEMKRKDEEMKRKDEEMKRKDEEMKRKDEEIFNKQMHQIEKALKRGDSLLEIADFFEMDLVTLQSYINILTKK